jgi:polysaccharide export outer membrane protein
MRWLRLVLLVLLVPLAACAISPRSATYPVDTKGSYALDSGDVVRVSVYGEAELTKSYRVDDSGAIAVPLVGAIKVRGLTTQMAASRLTSALASGYLREPSVAIEIETHRPFFIQGAVKNAGQFAYVYGMTVRAAISTAGGFSETADRTKAVVYRRKGDAMVKGAVGLDFPVFPGDTLVINERWF